jgi:predicted TIM-barrel fold metal-dependent hydrolase
MMQSGNCAVPGGLLPLAGQIMDSDAHENLPTNLWVERFGAVAADLAHAYASWEGNFAPPSDADDTEITAETVWQTKLSAAPGAFDMGRRLDVMDFTGVKRQLLFPGGIGLAALMLSYNADWPVLFPSITGDRRKYAHDVATAYNEWCVRQQHESNRIIPVALLLGQTPDELVAEARSLLTRGVRALWVPSAELPGGVSPAHPALDPFYDLIAAADACLCLHPAGDMDAHLLKTYAWREIPVFEGFKVGAELPLDPWSLVNLPRAAEVFVSSLVLGAVFERHPTLRFCVAETSADWIGPLAYRMDMWMGAMKFFENSGNMYSKGKGLPITLKPSEYVNRNIRVVAFEFEDVGRYIAQYGLEDVYVYASDFPHPEGGKDPMERTYDSLLAHKHSQDVVRKFFVKNAEWIMPD